MGIDSSIALGIKPIQIENPIDQYAKVSQLKQMQNQNRLADLMFSEKEREIASDNALAGLLAQGKSGADVATGLASQGYGAKSLAYTKQQAEMAKQQREAEKERLAMAKSQLEFVGQIAGSMTDPTSHARGLAMLKSMNVPTAGLEEFNPQVIQQVGTMALSKKDQLEQVWKQKGYDLDVSKFGYQQQNDAANRNVTIRGQNLTDARQRDQNNIMSQSNVIKTETDLRNEFASLPEVKNYKQAYPSFAAIKDAASRQGPQADINLIYGMAKLYDPNSVVREGEYATIANSQAIPERIKSLAQQLQGGGKLTPETKRQLLLEAQGRLNTYEAEYSKARSGYSDIASKRGADAGNVFTDAGGFKTVKVGGKSLTARQAPDGKFYVQQDGQYYEVR